MKRHYADRYQLLSDSFPVASPTCTLCRHVTPNLRLRTCTAFPEGIPNEIWLGRVDHKSAYPGDNGIYFELIDEDEIRAQYPIKEKEYTYGVKP